jgi:hypothetical protein
MAKFLCQVKKIESKMLVSGDVSGRITLEGHFSPGDLKELNDLLPTDLNRSGEIRVEIQ